MSYILDPRDTIRYSTTTTQACRLRIPGAPYSTYLLEELLRLEVRQVLELGVHDAARVPNALSLSACPVAVRLA